MKNKIIDISKKMSVKWLCNNRINFEKIVDQIRRYIQKIIGTGNVPCFSSQDLRRLVIALEKTHKEINKKISFDEIQKEFDKLEFIDSDIFINNINSLGDYYKTAGFAQQNYAFLSYLCVVLYLHEKHIKYLNENSDTIFTDEILKAINGGLL